MLEGEKMSYRLKSFFKVIVSVVLTTSMLSGNFSFGLVRDDVKVVKICVIPVSFTDLKPVTKIDVIYKAIKDYSNPESVVSYIKSASDGRMKLDFGSFDFTKWYDIGVSVEKYYEDNRKRYMDNSRFNADVVKMAIKQGLNLGEYDADKNGYIDNLVVIIPGFAKEFGGKYFYDYLNKSDSNNYLHLHENPFDEKTKLKPFWQPYNIQAFFRLSANIYNLEDLSYEIPIGDWDVTCDSRRHNNVGICSFNRYKLGWMDFSKISEPGVYQIDALCGDGTNKGYMIKMPGSEDEWIIIENRQKIGIDSLFDGIPSTGLVMYHYDNGRRYDEYFNFKHDWQGYVTWGLKVMDSDTKDLYHSKAVWSLDSGKSEMNQKNCKDNFPFPVKDYKGVHVVIKNISASGPKMTFELAYENTSMDYFTDVSELDFGNVRKGMQKTIPCNFFNYYEESILLEVVPKNNWIKANPAVVELGKASVDITVNSEIMPMGQNSGKLNYIGRSYEKTIPVKVNVTDYVGDVNGDGKVTSEDFEVFKTAYGLKKGEEGFIEMADFDDNGIIDLNDFFLFSKYWSN